MNLGQIESSLYDTLGFNSTSESATTRRIRGYVNRAHREILGKRAFSRLRRSILTTASVASSPFMVLPQAAARVIVLTDRANNRNLDAISLQDVRYRDPGLTFSGSTPDGYTVIDFSAAVALQPSAAASLYVISDSATDGSGVSCSIEGITSTGYHRRASVAMAGLTGVNLSSTISTWLIVNKFYISAAATGNVTLRQTSGAGTELARIPPGRSYARYTTLHLSPTPSAVQTFYCDVERQIDDMVAVNDEPLLHEDFHWLLEAGALKREYLKREKLALWKIEESNWLRGLSDYRAYLASMGGVSSSGQRENDGSGWSQLGANYPAGS